MATQLEAEVARIAFNAAQDHLVDGMDWDEARDFCWLAAVEAAEKARGLKMEITLFSGGYEPANVVTTINVPPFPVMPNAIVWGERLFFLNPGNGNQYIEGILYVAHPRSGE